MNLLKAQWIRQNTMTRFYLATKQSKGEICTNFKGKICANLPAKCSFDVFVVRCRWHFLWPTCQPKPILTDPRARIDPSNVPYEFGSTFVTLLLMGWVCAESILASQPVNLNWPQPKLSNCNMTRDQIQTRPVNQRFGLTVDLFNIFLVNRPF